MSFKFQASILLASVAGMLSAFLAGCASAKVEPETRQDATGVMRPPSVIYLRPFDITSGKWEGNTTKQPRRIQVRDWLMAELERNLSDIAPTRILTGDEMPDSGWLISGRFIRVNPGSKFQRMFIGLGAGGSRLETKINVYDLAVSSKEALVTFNTTGGSNLAAGPQTIFNNDSEGDIERTAREATEFLRRRLGPRDARAPVGLPAENLDPIEIGAPAPGATSTPGSPATDASERASRAAKPGGRQ